MKEYTGLFSLSLPLGSQDPEGLSCTTFLLLPPLCELQFSLYSAAQGYILASWLQTSPSLWDPNTFLQGCL